MRLPLGKWFVDYRCSRMGNHHGHNSGSILYELARTEVQSLFLQARMSATKCMFLSSSLLFMERGTFRGTDRHIDWKRPLIWVDEGSVALRFLSSKVRHQLGIQVIKAGQ